MCPDRGRGSRVEGEGRLAEARAGASLEGLGGPKSMEDVVSPCLPSGGILLPPAPGADSRALGTASTHSFTHSLLLTFIIAQLAEYLHYSEPLAHVISFIQEQPFGISSAVHILQMRTVKPVKAQ